LLKNCYIIVGKNGPDRLTKTPPSLRPGEIAIMVKIKIPDEVFQTPTFETSIQIEKDDTDRLKKYELELKRIKSVK
jgi:hypothetical protein